MTEEQINAHILALSRKKLAEQEHKRARVNADVLAKKLVDAERRERECRDELAEANRAYAAIPHPREPAHERAEAPRQAPSEEPHSPYGA